MYLRKIYNMGVIREVHNMYPANYGAPGMPRDKNRKKTPEEIKKQNRRNRKKKLQRLILANFNPGDWHLILNYKKSNRPEDLRKAKDRVSKLIDKMRDRYKRAGYIFKFIVVTERGKKGQALHHHLIIEDIEDEKINTVKLIKKLWIYGNAYWVDLYEEGEYEQLADYIVKKEGKEDEEYCSYSRSRNLIIPEPQKEEMKRKRWPEEPKAPRGWYIIKDSIINGENPVTKYPYQHYMMRKIETPEEWEERINNNHSIKRRKRNTKNKKQKRVPTKKT